MSDQDQNRPQDTEQTAAAGQQAPAAGEGAQGGDQPALEAQLEEAVRRAEENWEKFVRSQAELENQRRRAERELENAHKYALERFAQELLPVKDSLEMGLAAMAEGGEQVEKLREGTELTLKMLSDVMEKFGIREVNPAGEPFNPELHQAMATQESKQPANTVLHVMQKGYTLNERLLRPAMVVVSKAASEPGQQVDEKA